MEGGALERGVSWSVVQAVLMVAAREGSAARGSARSPSGQTGALALRGAIKAVAAGAGRSLIDADERVRADAGALIARLFTALLQGDASLRLGIQPDPRRGAAGGGVQGAGGGGGGGAKPSRAKGHDSQRSQREEDARVASEVEAGSFYIRCLRCAIRDAAAVVREEALAAAAAPAAAAGACAPWFGADCRMLLSDPVPRVRAAAVRYVSVHVRRKRLMSVQR